MEISLTIKNLRRLILNKAHNVVIDFSKISFIKKGDVLVFVAQMEKGILNYNKTYFRTGPLPSDRMVKNRLSEISQNSQNNRVHEYHRITRELTDAEKEKLLQPKIIDNIVKELKKIGIKEYYHPFYNLLQELIANAVEHGIVNKNINWWLDREINTKDKIISYTFVDMGVGIIGSHKNSRLPFIYYILPSKYIILDALNGKLPSSTKIINRGKGLPQLKQLIDKQFISNFVLITNKVRIEYKNNKFITSNNPNFVGTYYSWSIDKSNFEKWNKLK
jgi:hypothetical protein